MAKLPGLIVATQCIVPKRQSYFKISKNAFNFFTQNVHVGSRFAIDAAYKYIFFKFSIISSTVIHSRMSLVDRDLFRT